MTLTSASSTSLPAQTHHLVYKVGRELAREVLAPDSNLLIVKGGTVQGRLEIYLHVNRSAQLVAVRIRTRKQAWKQRRDRQ